MHAAGRSKTAPLNRASCVEKMGSRQIKIINTLKSDGQLNPEIIGSEARNVLIRLAKTKMKSICISIPKEYEGVFPGYTVEAYNLLVPELAKMGWVEIEILSPRDEAIVSLSDKALELLS